MSKHPLSVSFRTVGRSNSLPAANSDRRAGFTLVELLVVITIIGMLAALLMPAINRARENGRQTTCTNNQKEFGLAVQQYVTSKGQYPGYRSLMAVQNPPNSHVVASWQLAIMPNMGRNDLFEAVQAGNLQVQYWEQSTCPSDTTGAGKSDPWTSYVVNTGRLDLQPGAPPAPDSKYNGIFHDMIQPRATVNNHLKVTSTDIKDGQGTTLLLSENMDALYYSDKALSLIPAPATMRAISENPAGFNQILNAKNATERGAGFVWWDMSVAAQTPNPPTNPPPPHCLINGKRGEFDLTVLSWPSSPYDPNDTMNQAARPASSHPNGVIATFAGGNTRFIRDDIDYKVYCLLMTPYGAKAQTNSVGWQKAYPLNDGDY